MATKKNLEVVIKEKKALLNVLDEVLRDLSEKRKNLRCSYECVGHTDVQKTHWKTGELLWEDEEKTIPKYEKIYDYIERPEDELSEECKYDLSAIDTIIKHLESLL